jgi:hypothetical protein
LSTTTSTSSTTHPTIELSREESRHRVYGCGTLSADKGHDDANYPPMECSLPAAVAGTPLCQILRNWKPVPPRPPLRAGSARRQTLNDLPMKHHSPCRECEGIHQGSCRRHMWSTVFVAVSVGVFILFAVSVDGSVVGR